MYRSTFASAALTVKVGLIAMRNFQTQTLDGARSFLFLPDLTLQIGRLVSWRVGVHSRSRSISGWQPRRMIRAGRNQCPSAMHSRRHRRRSPRRSAVNAPILSGGHGRSGPCESRRAGCCPFAGRLCKGPFFQMIFGHSGRLIASPCNCAPIGRRPDDLPWVTLIYVNICAAPRIGACNHR